MRVVIVGAGEVGTSIANTLATGNDVVVVDKDEDRIEEIRYELDVLTLHGDGGTGGTLEEAGVGSADLLIASTDDDKTNIVTCGTAKTIGDPFTIARVRDAEFKRTWDRAETAFGVDFMVCSDLQTAETIVNVIGLPAAIDVDPFAGGIVQMAEFNVTDDSPVANERVVDVDHYNSLTFVTLFRDGRMILPDGSRVIEPGDHVVVIGSPESVQEFAQEMAPDATPGGAEEIVIVGGSEIGYHTARILCERDLQARIIESDEQRARYLAEELPEALVMHHDATDTEFLRREHIHEADILVSAMNADERNMLVALLAKRLGTNRVISLVDHANYVTLFEEIGIDVAVNPRTVTAEEITRFTHEDVALNVAVLENDQAEVLELELDHSSELIGWNIQDFVESIEGDIVFGAITRDGELVVPRGDTVLQPGDHIVVFVETPFVDEMISMT